MCFNLDRITIETHLFDFDEDIYNKNIEVFFMKRIFSIYDDGKYHTPNPATSLIVSELRIV